MIFIIKNNFFRFFFLLIITFTLFTSCDKEESSYNLSIDFTHYIDDVELVFSNDNLIYQNEANNVYGVRRLLYVISDVTLYFSDHSPIALEDFIFVNSENTETLLYDIEGLPQLCSGISFRLGFSSQENTYNAYLNSSYQFHDNMVWPNSFGVNPSFQGGYHYMKLEGRYINSSGNSDFYNNHTGPTNGEDYSVLYSPFNFTPTESIVIRMNINNFYNNPIYDINNFGGAIMENSDAQIMFYQNGYDVFTVELK